jgi:hypothetical protein
VVPVVLVDPHRLVAQTRRVLERASPTEGIVIPFGPRCLDVAASQALRDRALRIIDTVLKTLEARGSRVRIEQ